MASNSPSAATLNITELSPESILDLATPTPEYTAALEHFTLVPPVDWNDTSTALSKLRTMTSGVAFMGLHDGDVNEESLDCAVRDGSHVELRVHRRNDFDSSARHPLILLFHGGHHVLGFPGILSATAARLAKEFDAVVVSSAYRLAPEHPFPVGVQDGWDVLSWCAAHAEDTLYASPTQAGFIVGGVSSGGSMAAVLAHQARDQGLSPPLTGVYLACASVRAPASSANGANVTNLSEEYSSRLLSRTQKECVNSPILPVEMVDFMEKLYAPDKSSELFAPLCWRTGHAGLPRTYFQVCGIDVSRDENLIFAEMLRREGVATKVDLYKGLPHAFWGVLPALPQSEQWKGETVRGFAWLLGKAYS